MQLKAYLIALLLFCAVNATAATYYIDYTGGADSNNGTAKETPWKLAPGMQGCLITDENNNNCRARTHATTAGDTFVFKGGVTWPKEAFSFDWYFGNTTTFTVDATWYTGASWSRPILDGQGTEPTASPEGTVAMVRVYGTGHIVDNLEFTGMAQLHGLRGSGYMPKVLIHGTSNVSNGGEIKNCYFHGWSHGAVDGEGRWVGGEDIGQLAGDNFDILVTDGAAGGAPDLNLSIHHNVFDGSDTSKDMIHAAISSGAGHIYNNYFRYVVGVAISGGRYWWGNTFLDTVQSFDATQHMNGLYRNGATAGPIYIYNNLFYGGGLGVTIWAAIPDNTTSYIFNNLSYNDGNQTVQIGNELLTAANTAGIYVFNNTFQGTESYNLISGPTFETYNLDFLTLYNNHIISGGTVSQGTYTTTFNADPSPLYQTVAQATSANYVSTGTYPYYPPVGGATVNAGTDLASSICDTLADSSPSIPVAACKKDTTLGVVYNATTHTVTYPKRTAITRSTWDIGAYELDSGGTGPALRTGTGPAFTLGTGAGIQGS
jgi:hypothetical protein